MSKAKLTGRETQVGFARNLGGRRGWAGRGLLAAALALVIGFQIWTVRSSRKAWNFGAPQTDYYNLLVDGLLDGQLSMKAEVPPELLRSADPYDPAKRPPGIALHDVSLYHGKYYLYFGVVPAVTLLLPFTVITGMDLPLQAAVLIFALAGLVVSAALWCRVRRTYFPGVGAWIDAAGVLGLGMAGMGPVLLRRASVWELPIASAYFFAMVALFCIYQSLHASRRIAAWLAGAGLCLGLAVGSRPTYFFASAALAVPLGWWWWRGRGEKNWRWWPAAWWWRRAAAGVLPLAAIGAALAAYNYARFGSVFEFGVSYQLSGVYEGKVTHFSPRYVPLNFHRYFWAPLRWSGVFPFIEPEPVAAAPEGYFIGDDLFGLWRNVPLTWLAVVALWAAWRRGRAGRVELAVWAGAAVALFAGVAGFIVFFYSAMGRYLLDFAPAIVLLGCLGMAASEESIAGWTRGWTRALGRLLYGGALLCSVFFALMFSFQFNREFQIRNPGAYRVVARWFNHVPSWVGWLGGERYGPVEMELRLPRVSPGTEQTLLTTGLAPRQDRVFVRQTDAARIQIGFAHGEHDVQLSRPIVAAADAPHRLRVALGSLFPPEEFPASARWDGILGSKPARRLHIEWDGEPVLVGRQGFFPSSPGAVAISSGTTIAVRREGVARPEAETMCWRLRLRFPSAPGAEPLLRAERTGRVEQILVERAGEGAVRFRCVAEGGADAVSEAVPIELAAVHELEIRLTDETPRRRLTLKLDGQIAWAPRVTWGDWGTTTVAFGRAAGPDAGELFSAERFSGEVDPLMSSHGAMRLRVDFPRGRTGTREPLIVTGVTGRGDFLIVEYLDERRIRLIYDHWGAPSVASEPLEIDHGAAHDLEVSFGALLAGPETRVTALGPLRRLRVKLDGRGVFDRPAEFHLAEPDEVAIGVNRIGGTSCGGRFTGGIRAVQRLPLAGLSATQ